LGLLAAPSTWGFGHTPLLLGSGKFGTPLARMQREKASGWEFTDWVFGGAPAFDVPPEPVDDERPPHAAAASIRAAAAMIATTVRAPIDAAQSGRRKVPALSLTMIFLGVGRT
jgi:hypothetical protein